MDDIKNRLIPLDTPAEIAAVLIEQADAVRQKIESLSEALRELEVLREEVLQMQSVDFKKYADIIINLQMKNDFYWLIKHFDDQTLDHIRSHFDKDSGSVTVNGIMGIQLQSASLPKYIKALEAVKLFAKWNKTSLDHATLNALGIYEFAKKPYDQLSTGQKRRLHLALALTRNPDILFLDEPTAGLDVEGQISLHEHIRQLKAIGKTILLASHDMAEVENLCDRIAILSGGKQDITHNLLYRAAFVLCHYGRYLYIHHAGSERNAYSVNDCIWCDNGSVNRTAPISC